MICVKIETIATVKLTKFLNIPLDEWEEIKDDKEQLAFQVSEVDNDSITLIDNILESVTIV